MKKIAVLLANGFGLGLSPVASGTVGTLLAFPIVWAFCRILETPEGGVWTFGAVTASPQRLMYQVLIAVGLSLAAIPICGVAEKFYGTKDDGRIVADEYLTFPICMIGLPWNPWVLLVAFLSCRVFDIVKPPPANGLQGIGGGTGIVIDDVFASFYSLIFNHIFVWLVLARFVELKSWW
jgi:phosphatidylglycerophosphatase A